MAKRLKNIQMIFIDKILEIINKLYGIIIIFYYYLCGFTLTLLSEDGNTHNNIYVMIYGIIKAIKQNVF